MHIASDTVRDLPLPSPTVLPSGLPPDTRLLSSSLRHLPVVRAAIDALGIVDVVDGLIPPDPRSHVTHGECVSAMILNVLDGRVALYGMAEQLEAMDAELLLGEGRSAGAFSDDRLAKALDHLFEAGTDEVFTEVVMRQIRGVDFPKEHVLHADTTSFVLEGAYEDDDPDPRAPLPTWGHSKDFRPDAKQLVYGLTIHGGSGLPLRGRMLDGNTSDSAFNRVNIDAIARMLPPAEEATLVADCKLVDGVTLGRAKRAGFHYISRLPRSFALHDALLFAALHGSLEWTEALTVPGRKKAEPPKVYRATSLLHPFELVDEVDGTTSSTPHRFVVVESSRLREAFDHGLAAKLKAELARVTAAIARTARRPFATEEDASAALGNLAAEADLHTLRASIQPVERPAPRTARGRPRKGVEASTETVWTLALEGASVDNTAVATARHMASHFVLVTDHLPSAKWTDTRILEQYRAQSQVEGASGFRWLKDVAKVAPLFLKTPSRIAALGLVFLLALLVRNWIEARIRRALKESGSTLPNMLDRPVARPTTENVFRLFRNMSSVRFHHDGRSLHRAVPPLADAAKHALDCLGFSYAIFERPPRNARGEWWRSS